MTDDALRVLITDPHREGGGQVRYVANLSRELVRAGHRVAIACRPGSVLVDCAREAGAEAFPALQLRGGVRPQSWVNDFRVIARLFREWKPDVMHVNGSQDHWTAGYMTCLLRHPVCIVRTRHNTYQVKDNYFNRTLNRSWTDYQIVVCESVRKTLAAQPTFDASRMESIHNGVDAAQFAPSPDARERARAEFGYTRDHFVCGIVARLVAAKGHEFLFKAVAAFRETLPNLRVLVIGQGEREAYLRALCNNLGLNDRVLFAGFRNDMPYCVQALDAAVQPSVDCDTSSFTMKEAMAAEKPVIASDYGGLAEIVDDGIEGYIVPAGTVEPLAQALRAVADNPERSEAMGKAGRQRVLRDFTVEVFAARTVQAYRRAIQAHHEHAAHR